MNCDVMERDSPGLSQTFADNGARGNARGLGCVVSWTNFRVLTHPFTPKPKLLSMVLHLTMKSVSQRTKKRRAVVTKMLPLIHATTLFLIKLLGCGDAKYGKWESHVKYGTRPQVKYRTWGRNCISLLWLEPAFNVHRVNSFCYMKTFMSPLYMVFTKPISSFKHTCLKPTISQTKYSCSPASWSHSIVN